MPFHQSNWGGGWPQRRYNCFNLPEPSIKNRDTRKTSQDSWLASTIKLSNKSQTCETCGTCVRKKVKGTRRCLLELRTPASTRWRAGVAGGGGPAERSTWQEAESCTHVLRWAQGPGVSTGLGNSQNWPAKAHLFSESPPFRTKPLTDTELLGTESKLNSTGTKERRG